MFPALKASLFRLAERAELEPVANSPMRAVASLAVILAVEADARPAAFLLDFRVFHNVSVL